MIDPGCDSYEKVAKDHSWKNLTIFCTHSHWDHIADAARWKKETGASLWVHPLDAANLEYPGRDGIPCPLSFAGVSAGQFFEDQQEIPLFGTSVRILHTPGHSPGGVCFYFPEKDLLFSGDTMFAGGCGKTSFPGSDPDAMHRSLSILHELPEETIVYPGHGPTTVLGKEKSR